MLTTWPYRFLRGVLLAGLGCLISSPTQAADQAAKRPTIGVFEFKYGETNAPTGDHLADDIIYYLAKSEHFQVLERARLRVLVDEAGITDEMILKGDPNIFGRLRGCDFLMFGSIHVLQDDSTGAGNRKCPEVTLEGDYRVSDASGSLKHTGEFRSRVVGEAGAWRSGTKPTWQRYEKLTKDAVSDSAEKIVWDLITDLAPLKITGVDASRKITVNYGQPFLKEGAALMAVRPRNGHDEERPLGYLVVDYVSDGWARCIIHEVQSQELQKRVDADQWADLVLKISEILPPSASTTVIGGGEWIGKWHTRRAKP